jgi:hypothetical protein
MTQQQRLTLVMKTDAALGTLFRHLAATSRKAVPEGSNDKQSMGADGQAFEAQPEVSSGASAPQTCSCLTRLRG